MSDTNKPAPAQGAAPVKKTSSFQPNVGPKVPTSSPKSTPAPKVGAPTTGSASTAAAKVPPTQAELDDLNAQADAQAAAKKASTPDSNRTLVDADVVEGGISGMKKVTPEELERMKTVETTEFPPLETDEQLAAKNKAYQDQVKKGNFTKGASKEATIEENTEPLMETNGAENLVSIEGAIKALKMSPKGSTIVAGGDVIEKVANCGEEWEGYGFEVDNQLIQTNPYGFYIK
jgi:hypothetical protein